MIAKSASGLLQLLGVRRPGGALVSGSDIQHLDFGRALCQTCAALSEVGQSAVRPAHSKELTVYLRSERLAVEFFIQPAKDSRFSGAERFQPAVDQKVTTAARERNLFSLFHDRTTAAQFEFVSFGCGFVGF